MKELQITKVMKEKEIFEKIRAQSNKLTLRFRFTLTVSGIVFASSMLAVLISFLAALIFPILKKIPSSVQLITLGVLISVFVPRILASRFFRPIEKLRQGMKNVADGNFDTKLESQSSAKEFQELIAGFNMMTEELKSTEILGSDFVSNVSHEFKTPINAIEGYATLLQGRDGADDAEKEYVEKILFNTGRLSSLVSNVLLLSKIENQSLSLHKSTYDLGEQIREELLSYEDAWTDKSIEFDVELDDVYYTGYETLMRHVWGNLISNAIKFSPMGGKIKIGLQDQKDKLVFTIEDQGPGISNEAKKHIFDKFYQEDTSHKSEGNGLGLALVKRILTVTGGSVLAENLPEGGCKFTVELVSS